jgi:hypothetical protein
MGDLEFIQQMMDNLYPQLNTPGGPYYLPTFVQSSHYDPYGPFAWALGQLTDPTLLDAASTICSSIDIVACGTDPSFNYITAPIPPNYPTLSLAACYLGGMMNVVAERPMAQPPDGRNISMKVDFGTLSSYPTAITIGGNFTFTNFCCCSTDPNQKICSGQPQAQVGLGAFKATMPSTKTPSARGNAVINFSITALAPGVLNMVVRSVQFNPPLLADGKTPSMDVTIDITSIPKGANRDSYNGVAQKAFGSAQAQQVIINQINTTMNEPGNLATISDILTKDIDGFLRANHMYPFDNAAVALV